MKQRILLPLIALSTLLLAGAVDAKIVTTPVGKPCSSMFNYKGKAYFCADHPLYGKELHVADGGRFTTKIVSDLDPGLGGSNPFGFFELRDHLYFFAETTADGYALWRTDGSEQGTKRIRSISQDFGVYPSPMQSLNGKRETIVAELGGTVYFEGYATPQEMDWRAEPQLLFRTDGTAAGTVEIEDTRLVEGYISATSYWNRTSYQVHQGTLFYLSYGELHQVSGDNSIKVADIPFDYGGSPTQFTNLILDNKMVLAADGEIWLSDGTPNGTVEMPDVEGPKPSTPIAVFNNKVLYQNSYYLDGTNLLRTVDTGPDPTLIEDTDGILNLISEEGALLEGRLIFSNRGKTFTTDGTTNGTLSVNRTNINFPRQVGDTFFAFNDAYNPSKLVKFSPRSLSVNLIKAGLNESSMVGETTPGVLFTDNPSRYSTHLWVSDGTISGTRLIKRLSGTSYRMNGVHQEGGRAYMINLPNANGSARELWHSDGTSSGTYRLDFRYGDDEIPDDSAQRKAIPPVLDLLLDDED